MKKIFTKENMKKFFGTYIWLMVLLFVIDIVTKWIVVNHYGVDLMNRRVSHDSPEVITVIKDFCYIGGAINNKAAFSLGPNRWILLAISIIMTAAFIIYYVHEFKKMNTTTKVALALMIAGGFGNLIDRAFYWPSTTGFNGVVDWILFVFWGHEFAMFNIADSCLVIGIIILIVEIVIDEVKNTIEKGKKGEYKYSPEELEKKNNEGNKGN